MTDIKAIAEAVIKGKQDIVVSLIKQALAEGAAPADILNDGLIAGMMEVGRRFKANEVYVPEVLLSARAMSNSKDPSRPGGLEVLQPYLTQAGVEMRGKIVIGTVKGDLHDIGKNLVVMMLKGAGFEVIDLGIDVPADKFVRTVKEQQVKLLGLSALLTTTMPQMKNVIQALKDAGLADVKVMIGGAPVTQAFADEIGADGYSADAASAVDKAKELLGVN